jgi:drug/metabolite transporter (DMT)-like permease
MRKANAMILDTNRDRIVGSVLIALSAVCYSTAGLFTRVIQLDVWTILFYRGVFASLFLAAYLLFIYRKRFVAVGHMISLPSLIATFFSALAMICNLTAYRNTSVANVVVIYAAAPFVSAAIAWIVLREPFAKPTMIASLLALAGVLVMMGGSLETGHIVGDLLALLMTIFMSAMMVAIRFGSKLDMLPSALFSSLASIFLTLPFASPLAVSEADLVLLAIFGVSQLGLGLLFLTEGAKRIPAAQSALIGSLDIPFAILLVWMAFSEVPPFLTVIGGSIVLLAAGTLLVRDLQKGRTSTPQGSPA